MKWCRRYTKRMEDEPKKIKNILANLKEQSGNQDWEEIEGYQALTTVRKSPIGVSFDPSSGVIIKGFINRTTGEVRTYFYKAAAKE